MRKALLLLALFPLALSTPACVGTTGSGLVDFDGTASGPPDSVGLPNTMHAYAFDTLAGFHVTLTQATVHIGAVYLTATPPNGSSANTSCVNPGRYVAELPGPIDMDALSPTDQAFSVVGDGTADQALSGEVWLVGGTEDVNATEDVTDIVITQGTATKGGVSYPFQANVTIGSNRAIPSSDPSQPGLNPICKRRIVSNIPVDLELSAGGSLHLEVDPRGWFTNVDFSQIAKTGAAIETIPDDDSTTPGRNLFEGIHASQGVYTFSFRTP